MLFQLVGGDGPQGGPGGDQLLPLLLVMLQLAQADGREKCVRTRTRSKKVGRNDRAVALPSEHGVVSQNAQ